MKPTKSILDRTFRYTSSHNTNIRLRFNRERVRLELEQRWPEPEKVEARIDGALVLNFFRPKP